MEFGTNAVHAGRSSDPITGALIPSISLSTTFQQQEPGVLKSEFDYSRCGNPNRSNFEQAVTALEQAKYGVSFSSGCAVTACVCMLCPTKSHIISINDVYGGTYRFLNRVAKEQLGYEVSWVDLAATDEFILKDQLEKIVTKDTSLLWIESPTNPTLRITNIQMVSRVIKKLVPSIIIVIDNTFMSPYLQTPLEHGADIVVHSVTKYLNGHSDVVMGIALTNQPQLHSKLVFLQKTIGAVPSPFDCFLASRGLQTLHIRMERHSSNALDIATWLESCIPKYVTQVIYPGLASHPQYETAKLQHKRGHSGMISFKLNQDLSPLSFFKFLNIFSLAESLGGVESLIELPYCMTHASLSPQDRSVLGITDNLIRISVGIEDVRDLIHDLQNAFEKCSKM